MYMWLWWPIGLRSAKKYKYKYAVGDPLFNEWTEINIRPVCESGIRNINLRDDAINSQRTVEVHPLYERINMYFKKYQHIEKQIIASSRNLVLTVCYVSIYGNSGSACEQINSRSRRQCGDNYRKSVCQMAAAMHRLRTLAVRSSMKSCKSHNYFDQSLLSCVLFGGHICSFLNALCANKYL